MSKTQVKKLYEEVKKYCDPNVPQSYTDIFNLFCRWETSNFVGGIGDIKRTKHEKMYSLLFPYLEEQVTFGTGRGGYEKYLTKKYVVDFYDRKRKIIHEIDGENHKNEVRQLKDQIRDYFFWHELGIETIRISNQKVEKMLFDRLEKLYEEGVLIV